MEEQDFSLRTRFRQVGQHACHRRNADSGAGEHHGTVGVLHDYVAKRCGENHLVSDVHGVVEEVWTSLRRAGRPDPLDGELPVAAVVGFREAVLAGLVDAVGHLHLDGHVLARQ